MTLSAGTIIADKYEVQSIIGSGGMGSVYRVQQLMLNKAFALKIIDVQQQSEMAIRRFQQEARTTAQLRHSNLVEVVDFGVFDDSQPYIVMDLIEGKTLAQVLKNSGSLAVDYVVELAIQIARGLEYAHSKGVVHRDIKPSNIIILQPNQEVVPGNVKIVDFGIAKIVQSEQGQIQELTKTGEIFGSPVYMSPEQCQGTLVDQRTDIYSLGCVLFECLTGSPPFLAENAMSTMVKRLTQAPVSLKEGSLGVDFPAALENILNKMLQVDPNNRYQELDSFIDDLTEFQNHGQTVPSSSAPITPTSKKLFDRKDLKLVAATCALCSGATLFFDYNFFLPKSSTAGASATSADANSAETNTMQAHLIPDASAADSEVSRETSGTTNIASLAPSGPTAGAGTASDRTDNSFMVFAPKNIESPTRRIIKTERGWEELIHFPYDSGELFIIGAPIFNATADPRKAQGDPHFKLGSKISLVLNEETSKVPGFLKNLTDVNFSHIRFVGALTTNKCIEILQQVNHFDGLNVSGTEISSLKPIYDNKQLNYLDTTESQISAKELLNLKRLKELRTLMFGPIADPQMVLNAMRDSDSLREIAYRGPRHDVPLGELEGRGLKFSDVDSMLKLKQLTNLEIQNSPAFDDACLRKLVTMKSLKHLILLGCSITPKSLPFLKTCHIEVLELDPVGWSPAQLDQLNSHMPFHFEHTKYRTKQLENELLVKDLTSRAGMFQANGPIDEHSPPSSSSPK